MVTEPSTKPEDAGQIAAPDFSDFRDHIATADKDGRRRWLYPRKPHGPYYQWRVAVSWVLLGVLFAGPFVKINGNPLLMMNFFAGRFSILGHIFWPQDMALLAVALLLFFAGIMIFTSAFGRLWCGWTCPQTIFMEMVFRRIEYLIEGDAHQQRELDKGPWNARKVGIKAFKHVVFFAISFLIANLLLSYIIGLDKLRAIITDDLSLHYRDLTLMLVFTGIFYAVFARFREQACTFICPYGRFQSTVLDENTMVITYDYKRGEKRAPLNQRPDKKGGDCIDCHLCVSVCPTGIDIRDGIQMECVNCAACIDACDSVMSRLKQPTGLIRYASLNSIERGHPFKFTARMFVYSCIVTALAGLLAFLVLTRANVEASLLRAPGALFQELPNGHLENLYILQLINKTSRPVPVELKLEDVPGTLSIMGEAHPVIPREQLFETSVLVEMAPGEVVGGKRQFQIGLYSEGKRLQVVHTTLIGPRN